VENPKMGFLGQKGFMEAILKQYGSNMEVGRKWH